MTAGVQAWDEDGNLVLDLTDSVGKILGVMNIGALYTGSVSSGTIVEPRFTSLTGHTPFYAVIDGASWNLRDMPTFSISGNNLTWQYLDTARPNVTFIWGVA